MPYFFDKNAKSGIFLKCLKLASFPYNHDFLGLAKISQMIIFTFEVLIFFEMVSLTSVCVSHLFFSHIIYNNMRAFPGSASLCIPIKGNFMCVRKSL